MNDTVGRSSSLGIKKPLFWFVTSLQCDLGYSGPQFPYLHSRAPPPLYDTDAAIHMGLVLNYRSRQNASQREDWEIPGNFVSRKVIQDWSWLQTAP